jgi:hypothetical protein
MELSDNGSKPVYREEMHCHERDSKKKETTKIYQIITVWQISIGDDVVILITFASKF